MDTQSDNDPEAATSDAIVPRQIDQFLHNQGREARESLAAQERVMREQLLAHRRQKTDFYWIAGFSILVVATILGLSLWLNKDEVALEIIKDIVLLLGGGAGGYSIGHNRAQSSGQDPPSAQ